MGTVLELGGFPIKLAPNGKDTLIGSKPRERRTFNGRDYILEDSVVGDYALVKGWKADTKGNVMFRKTARNFNPEMATAAKKCIVEVEEIVNEGELDPDSIHLPACYVDSIVKGEVYEKRIEFRTLHVEG